MSGMAWFFAILCAAAVCLTLAMVFRECLLLSAERRARGSREPRGEDAS